MERKRRLQLYRCLLSLMIVLLPASIHAITVPREVVSTAAVVAAGILYAASYEAPERSGHLRAFTLNGSRRTLLWDAAERVPLPGASLPPPADPGIAALVPQFNDNAGVRLIFTNLDATQGYRLLTFDAQASHVLQPLLGVATVVETAALINTVRGRLDASATVPAGSGDRLMRLGAISRSTPALVGSSPFAVAAVNRDQVLYVGAEDGLLHAILAGRRESAGAGYDYSAEGCGEELWAYLPGTLLPYLKAQPFDPPGQVPTVHVDGSPAVGEMFIDSDGDGRREWRTVLVGTASVQALNQGVVFALDVTDPRVPRLLWETALTELGLGRSRGVALRFSGDLANPAPRVFLTAGTMGRVNPEGTPDPLGGYGALACALDLTDGRLLWRFASQYQGAAAGIAEPPSIPSLMMATDGGIDGVVFGDLAGRLWLLDPESGLPRGGGSLWQTPGGADEPIGAGLAVRNRLVLFGTGGVDYAADDRTYAVYAIEILTGGARLLWTQPLAPGEKLWGAPVLDRFGRTYFGVGTDEEGSGGRLLVVAADGTLSGSAALAGNPHGGLAVAPGAVIAVSSSGQVDQLGELRQGSLPGTADPGRVRVLSWRIR